MLDRLSLSLVSLPNSTYDTIIILTDANNTRTESQNLLNRHVLARLVQSLKPNGRLRSQDGTFASTDSEERREAILAGLLISDNGATKPDYSDTQSVPLRFGKTKAEGGPTSTTTPIGTGVASLNINGKRANNPPIQSAGVGFVDFSDDFDVPVEEENSDDELIDEDTLLDESDLTRPVVQRTSPAPPHPVPPLSYHLTNPFFHSQLPNAPPNPGNAAAPAKTAPAVSPPSWKPKTEPNAPPPTKPSPSSPNWTRMTWPRSISRCREK